MATEHPEHSDLTRVEAEIIEAPRMGRPTKLTEKLSAKFCELLENGCYVSTAAEVCGISADTAREWLRRGEAGEEPFSTFRRNVEAAQARSRDYKDAMGMDFSGFW